MVDEFSNLGVEEDNSLYRKILFDLCNVIESDTDELEEFTIVPVTENENKSPVLYEEGNLGLESWCIKSVYRYAYKEIFRAKRDLRRNRLRDEDAEELNRLLLGALLLHPDVTTFWNMRKDLVLYWNTTLNMELLLTKLVLSYKSKCNDAFSHRRWVLRKLTEVLNYQSPNDYLDIVNEELSVARMAANKMPNNYHVWNHRIWIIENLVKKKISFDSLMFEGILNRELDFSLNWIEANISQHSGFHYRQYLIEELFRNVLESNLTIPHYRLEELALRKQNVVETYLHESVGNGMQRSMLSNYVSMCEFLKIELISVLNKLDMSFPGHESIWYYRRFVIHFLLKIMYQMRGLTWKQRLDLNGIYISNITYAGFNIINCDFCDVLEEDWLKEYPNKMICDKLRKIKTSMMYKSLIEEESLLLKTNTMKNSSNEQKLLAQKHENWLRLVLNLITFSSKQWYLGIRP